MPFLLCSAKPTEHLFICVMVSTAADPSPDYGKLTLAIFLDTLQYKYI